MPNSEIATLHSALFSMPPISYPCAPVPKLPCTSPLSPPNMLFLNYHCFYATAVTPSRSRSRAIYLPPPHWFLLPSVLHCPIVCIADARIYIADYRCESVIRRIKHPYFGCRSIHFLDAGFQLRSNLQCSGLYCQLSGFPRA